MVGVMRQVLDVLGEPFGAESLDSRRDARVKGAAPLPEHAPVRHLVGQRMLEGVLDLGKEARLVEKFRRLQVHKPLTHVVVVRVGDGDQQRVWDILAHDGRRLQQAFVFRRQSIDACGQDRLHGRGHLKASWHARQMVGAALAAENLRLHQRSHAFFQEQRIALRALDQKLLQ
jgi:hypothetical protein